MFQRRVFIASIVFSILCAAAYADKGNAAVEALKKHELTLEQCIKNATDEAGGVAVYANILVGKHDHFQVHVSGTDQGETWTAAVDAKGNAEKRKKRANRPSRNEAELDKIAAKFSDRKVTLGELAAIAEREAKGTAISARGYIEGDAVLVRVTVVVGDEIKQVVVDPHNKKVVDKRET